MPLPKLHKDAPPLRRAFAKRLAARRIAAGYEFQYQFAEEAGIDPRTYGTYERARNEPDITKLAQICNILECTPNDLLLPQTPKRRKAKSDTPARLRQIAS